MLKPTLLTLTLAVTMVASALAHAERTRVRVHDIKDWQAKSNQELVIETYSGNFYRAKTFNQCIGLRIAEDLAFVTRGGNTIDAFSSIVLPDGTRCGFRTFEPVTPETED